MYALLKSGMPSIAIDVELPSLTISFEMMYLFVAIFKSLMSHMTVVSYVIVNNIELTLG